MSSAPERPSLLSHVDSPAGDADGLEIVVRVRGAAAVRLSRLVEGLERLAADVEGRVDPPLGLSAPDRAATNGEASPAMGECLLDAVAAAALIGVEPRRLNALVRRGLVRRVEGVSNGYKYLRSHLLADMARLSMTAQESRRSKRTAAKASEASRPSSQRPSTT